MENIEGTVKVQVEVEVPLENAWTQLVCAFEGGSNYWLTELDIESDHVGGTGYTYAHQLPLLEGCALILHDSQGFHGWEKPFRLDLDAIKKGIELAGKRTYNHCSQKVNILADVLMGDDGGDACTGDMFLQLCVFGEVIMS